MPRKASSTRFAGSPTRRDWSDRTTRTTRTGTNGAARRWSGGRWSIPRTVRFRKRHGQAVSLALAAHRVAAVAMTVALTAAAALSGRGGEECLLVAATVLVGQCTVGWVEDLADRHRDRQVGRQDRPVAMGWVEPGTVLFAVAVATLIVVPLAVANGTEAGLAYLGSVGAAWSYPLWFNRSWLSWLPYAVGYALLPAFLSYGGLGGGFHGGPPTLAVTALAALLGVGVHFLVALPDLAADRETGLRHLPLRVALRIGAPRLRWVASAYTLLVAVALLAAEVTTGPRQ